MKKVFVLLVILVIAGFALAACIKDAVTYCPFCGKADVREISVYDLSTGITTISYECQNSNCGRKFGAGKYSPSTGGTE